MSTLEFNKQAKYNLNPEEISGVFLIEKHFYKNNDYSDKSNYRSYALMFVDNNGEHEYISLAGKDLIHEKENVARENAFQQYNNIIKSFENLLQINGLNVDGNDFKDVEFIEKISRDKDLAGHVNIYNQLIKDSRPEGNDAGDKVYNKILDKHQKLILKAMT